MRTHSHVMEIASVEKTDFIDITDRVNAILKESSLKAGIVNVFPLHTTTCVRVNENEPRLLRDLRRHFDEMVPSDAAYKHDDMEKRPVPEDEKVNGHSHIKSFILGTGESVPFAAGRLQLGVWQSIFFVDFDGPQTRKVIVSVLGER